MERLKSDEKKMNNRNTKEEILLEALKLFSNNGYESVSVRDIAGKLNISQAALYRHYKNKQDIFDSIVKHMNEDYAKRMVGLQIPDGELKYIAKKYQKMSDETITKIGIAQFLYWTQNKYAACFRKMLAIEQYRNEKMARLYQKHLGTGVISYMTELFRELEKCGYLKNESPEQTALEFYAPFYMMISLYDGTKNREEIEHMMKNHISTFMKEHRVKI